MKLEAFEYSGVTLLAGPLKTQYEAARNFYLEGLDKADVPVRGPELHQVRLPQYTDDEIDRKSRHRGEFQRRRVV
jgi:hypothetical protein